MKLFTFRGSHFEVGLAIGKSFSRQIKRALANNTDLQNTYLPFHHSSEGKRKYEKLIQLHRLRFPQYISELEGISKGAGVSFEELFLVNMRGEYRIYARKAKDIECSTCSLLTAKSAVFAHNEDGSPIYHGQMYLVRIEVQGSHPFAALCYPGFLPGNAFGFNSEGICFSANSIIPKGTATGLGRQFIARSLFEARSLKHALKLATIPGRASGFNYTIGSLKERRIINLEVSPHTHSVLEIRGCFFHANHYIRLAKVDQLITHSSQSRQKRGEMLLAKGLAEDKEGVLKVLRDHKVRDYPILRNGRQPDSGVTLVTALFDLDSRKLAIYLGGLKKPNQTYKPLIEIPIE